MHKKTVVDFKELGHRLIFENPVKILATKLIDDVEAILKKVVYYQSQGYYVVGYVSYEAGKAFENNFSVKTFPLSGLIKLIILYSFIIELIRIFLSFTIG